MNLLRNSLLLPIILFAATLAAETKIHEVQVFPPESPQQLVIWGTDFWVGDDPIDPSIFFGTEPSSLTISADQGLCGEIPAPPLDVTDSFDCIVVDLPEAANYAGAGKVPAGDYLLKIIATMPFANCDNGKPDSLTFEYAPTECTFPLP
jgi:hypothetical protein